MKRFVDITFFLFLLIFAGTFVAPKAVASGNDVNSQRLSMSLDELDKLFADRDKYTNERETAINSLKNSRNASETATFEAIAKAYMDYDNDSALVYFNKAIEVARTPAERYRLISARAAVMPQIGLNMTAINQYEAIPVDSLNDNDLAEYYDNGRKMYASITAFYAYYPDEAIKWSKKVLECHEKLLEVLSTDKDSPLYRANYGEYMLRSGHPVKAESLLREVFETEASGSPLKTRAAHILSHLAHNRGDINGEAYYLVSAVSNDLITGQRDLPSLQDLGQLCMKSGDVSRAYRYFNIALANGAESKSLIRMVQTSRALPIINAAHEEQLHERSVWLVASIIVLAVALIALIVMMIFRQRQKRNMRQMLVKLSDANRTKEIYIAQFLSMCSIYMDKLTQLCKTINRKLTAGKTDEVLRMTKSSKYIEQQNAEFYETFDNAFLHIYPTFITEINKLLREDEQIVLREDEVLNTDLRILAFMRLGIDDSSKIAQILNYSLNTIYTYRNKLKTRAINRDTFETDIMKIDSV